MTNKDGPTNKEWVASYIKEWVHKNTLFKITKLELEKDKDELYEPLKEVR